MTTIVEDQKRFVSIGFNPLMNDFGQVSFAARLNGGKKPDTEAILLGDGRKLTGALAKTRHFSKITASGGSKPPDPCSP